MAGRVRLSDVAHAAGVSLATVDRVINQRGGVKAEKEERILAAARRLGLDRRLERAPTRIARVAVLIQPPQNPFHAALSVGVELARKAHGALGLQLQIRHVDPERPERTAALIAGLAGQVEGAIVCTGATPAITAALAALAAEVPVVTLATDIDASGRAAYVGPDDARSGRVAADLMGRFLGADGGPVLMIAGRLDIAGQSARARGFAELLARRYPRCTLARIIETGEAGEAGARKVAAALRDTPGVRGIYHVSVGTGGIVEALERLGRADEVCVITHELTPNRRRLLRARKIDAVIDQQPHEEARLAVETMARLLGRLDGAPGSISTDIRIFMPENA